MVHGDTTWVQYMRSESERLGAEVAQIDNETLKGTWQASSLSFLALAVAEHRAAIMRDFDGLPNDDAGNEARRVFSESYDRTVDWSVQAAGGDDER